MTKRRGILLSIVSILFAFSIIVFFLNFQLFLDTAAPLQADATLRTQSNAISKHVEEIIDLHISVERNQTVTEMNFTDRLPRADAMDNEVEAYGSFLEKNLNISYTTQVNFTAFLDDPVVKLDGINAEYQYPDFTKTNMSLVQKAGDTLFVKKYNITINSLHGHSINNCTLASGAECTTHTDTDNLTVVIDGDGTCTLCDIGPVDVARGSATTFSFNYSDNGVGKQVNITVGTVDGNPSSLQIVPETNVSAITVMTVKDNQVP